MGQPQPMIPDDELGGRYEKRSSRFVGILFLRISSSGARRERLRFPV
jgi:hypothetical protein